ncbi:unnamed protein product [Fraxinus pennsylvanica]|uniref:Uncharacterized protein n=1 Tax=Fraxinus pennsylvanica TaxID=56036 RepID=A0AAD1Z7Y9_9LAMI|nr:unnamed protein product [Fraxinus pennsylvanica]
MGRPFRAVHVKGDLLDEGRTCVLTVVLCEVRNIYYNCLDACAIVSIRSTFTVPELLFDHVEAVKLQGTLQEILKKTSRAAGGSSRGVQRVRELKVDKSKSIHKVLSVSTSYAAGGVDEIRKDNSEDRELPAKTFMEVESSSLRTHRSDAGTVLGTVKVSYEILATSFTYSMRLVDAAAPLLPPLCPLSEWRGACRRWLTAQRRHCNEQRWLRRWVKSKHKNGKQELTASVQELAARAANLTKAEAAKNIAPPDSA